MSNSIYDMYETDDDNEIEGIILNYGEGIRIKIARAGGANVAFAKAFEKATRPYRKRMDMGTLDESVANELLVQVFAQTVVKDWEGVTDREGNELKFNVENCVKVFMDLPDLFADVKEASMSVANYRYEEIEDDIKN